MGIRYMSGYDIKVLPKAPPTPKKNTCIIYALPDKSVWRMWDDGSKERISVT